MFSKSRKIHPMVLVKPEINKPKYIDITRPLNDEDKESVCKTKYIDVTRPLKSEDNVCKTKTGNLRVVIPNINYNNKMLINK